MLHDVSEQIHFLDMNHNNHIQCMNKHHKYVNNFMGNQVYVNHLFDYNKNPENLLMRIAYSFCAFTFPSTILYFSHK